MTRKTHHASLLRLFDVAGAVGVVGPKALAMALGESEATVTNWAARGVSIKGAVKAEDRFGCSPVWILKGTRKNTQAPADVSPMAHFLAHEIDKIPEQTMLAWVSVLGNLVSEAQQGHTPSAALTGMRDPQIPSEARHNPPGANSDQSRPGDAPDVPQKHRSHAGKHST